MPGEAASDYQLVRELIARGMNCMRVNCSYDDPHAWIAMAEHLKRARLELGQECRIQMDLAGPKLRVGEIVPGPEVIKMRPRRDVQGNGHGAHTDRPGSGVRDVHDRDFGGYGGCGDSGGGRPGRAPSGRPGRVYRHARSVAANNGYRTRGRVRGGGMQPHLLSGIGIGVASQRRGRCHLSGGPVAGLRPADRLRKGDKVVLSTKAPLGKGAELGENGRVPRPAIINCTIPEIVRDLKAGERVWFDDGKIGGMIKRVTGAEATIEITNAATAGSKLRANKGINLPDSNLSVASLTPKDLEDLTTAAAQADIVGMSFVRSPGDVESLVAHLLRLGRPDIGILLKIETRQAFDNLPLLVLAAMRRPAAGVMFARGDLAVECGYERMAEIQEEILWVCEAAHMPVVWATQVLESLAKKGLPSRAEITDAAMGERAECVMLNKGPHLCDAVGALDDILRRMQDHQVKKSAMLRRLKRW